MRNITKKSKQQHHEQRIVTTWKKESNENWRLFNERNNFDSISRAHTHECFMGRSLRKWIEED